MKRSNIRRYTELKRTPLARKSRMKRVSSKTAKRRRQAKGPREQYVASVLTCQCCFRRKASECHEIVTRAQSAESILFRCCYLALCHECHRDELSDYSRWPVTRQLALKLVADAAFFDLAKVNELRGRDANAITLADVARHLEVSP